MQPAITRRGLTAEQADLRLQRDGRNVLPRPRRISPGRRLARELVHFFALMLWTAAGLAVVAHLPQLAVAIVLVIVLNALFAFLQERRADRAAERLRALLPSRIAVFRDGRRTLVEASAVVTDDLLLLTAGDRVPADGCVQRSTSLRLDTSLLTGESVPTTVDIGDPVYAGTLVVEGDGDVMVTATADRTRLAEIARLSSIEPKPMTPLTRELRRVVRTIAVIAFGAGLLFFVITLALGNPPSDGLVFGIGVMVALVPEALLPTVTLTLAWGAEQMARRHVLVRDLEAVETLGSTTFICTDKTGTLTRNEMTVVEAWTSAGTAMTDVAGYGPVAPIRYSSGEVTRAAMLALAQAAALSSDGYADFVGGAWVAHGDPMEAALDAFASRVGAPAGRLREQQRAVTRFPFDPRRRMMSVVVDGYVYAKGAPDALERVCGSSPGARQVMDDMASRGLRVIAVASRSAGLQVPACAAEAETDLTLLGLMGLQDPPRAGVGAAIDACRRAGIRVAMVTGDHPGTATAIADEVGLRTAVSPVVIGEDLPADRRALGAMIDQPGIVIARVSPEDKLRIAEALRARGHVVAMTGDGVNDVPALHAANIGIAMGASGTDVAREAADLVLLDDRFESIVAGVELGRTTYVNIRRFLTYHLTDNVAELTPFVLWAISGGSFPLALGVLQILALDIGTDTMSAVALGAEPPARHLLDGPPVSGRLLNRTVLRRAFGLLGPVMSAASMLAFLATFVALGWRPGAPFPIGPSLLAASGGAFITVVLAQMANAFACRSSTVWPGTLGWTTNRLLIPAVLFGLAISLGTLLLPPVAQALQQSPPVAIGWFIALASMPLILAVDAADKRIRARRRRFRRDSDREH